MAEPSTGLDLRRTLLLVGVGVVILVAVVFFVFRGCASISASNSYTTIYSNLDLTDAAKVIAILKKEKLDYKIKQKGTAIAVKKDKADQARLALAENNLPAGGVVGWEIFDESKLGATDFDRRIQLIRAISGELSRTIKRIEGVKNARVQIVIPETKLFATNVAPVTGSVMLHLSPGQDLTAEKINGIVHLVASSVENLQPTNVTVVDDTGKILSNQPSQIKLGQQTEPISNQTTPETIVIVAQQASAEVSAEAISQTVSQPAVVENKIMTRLKAKKQLEKDLTGKAQEILNRFYPPQSALVKINIEVEDYNQELNGDKPFAIKKLDTVILVDNRVDLPTKLKQTTFKAVAAAISYDRKRGDKIVLQKVPFHLATPAPGRLQQVTSSTIKNNQVGTVAETKKQSFALFVWLKRIFWLALLACLIFIALKIFQYIKGRDQAELPREDNYVVPAKPKNSNLDSVKQVVNENPEQIANLLKKWLTEE